MEEPVFPTSVRIGCLTYEIQDWQPRAAQASSRYGECSSVEQAIRVDLSQSRERVILTLLHEIMHAVYRAIRFDDVEHPSEEFLVSATSEAVTTMMRDNPELRDWFGWAWSQR